MRRVSTDYGLTDLDFTEGEVTALYTAAASPSSLGVRVEMRSLHAKLSALDVLCAHPLVPPVPPGEPGDPDGTVSPTRPCAQYATDQRHIAVAECLGGTSGLGHCTDPSYHHEFTP